MPHIIFEYPQNVLGASLVSDMLLAVHRGISGSGLFKSDQIRTRAYPFSGYTNAGSSEPYIHIQARIKSGRDDGDKRRLAEVILSSLEPLGIPVSVITVEIIDMHRDSYGKCAPSR